MGTYHQYMVIRHHYPADWPTKGKYDVRLYDIDTEDSSDLDDLQEIWSDAYKDVGLRDFAHLYPTCEKIEVMYRVQRRGIVNGVNITDYGSWDPGRTMYAPLPKYAATED